MRATTLLMAIAASALSGTACATLTFERADAPVQAGALSSDARAALTRRWPGWQPAVLDPQVASCAAGQKELPVMVEYDADGDSASDVAIAVQTRDGTRLVVIMNRSWDADVHDVDSLGGATANAFLGVMPRGRRFTNPATRMDDYFGNPAITATGCGGPVAAYRWNGSGFQKVLLDAR